MCDTNTLRSSINIKFCVLLLAHVYQCNLSLSVLLKVVLWLDVCLIVFSFHFKLLWRHASDVFLCFVYINIVFLSGE